MQLYSPWVLLALLILFGETSDLSASGFAINEQSTSAISMGLAVSARLDDPSTIFYNPGGLGYLDGINIYVGGALLFPLFNYSDPEGFRPSAKNTKRFALVPNLYISYRIKYSVDFLNTFWIFIKKKYFDTIRHYLRSFDD